MKEHAVVLSGGGANGAYEVGVMEALFGRPWRRTRQPVNPTIFVGTSVGSYNAAAMVSLSDLGAPAAVRKLRAIWMDRIAGHADRANGVFRIRTDVANLPRDAIELASNWLQRGVDLALSSDPPVRRLLRMFAGDDLFSTSPLESLISETISVERLLHTKIKLRIVACNWDTGEPVVFCNNSDPKDRISKGKQADYERRALTEGNAKHAILASTAIPAIFPSVRIDDAYFVDGGVVMNTPLRPAIDGCASVLHVVHLEPKLAMLPLGRAPSAVESMERILSATPARIIDADIHRAKLENGIVEAKRRYEKLGNGRRSGFLNQFADRRWIEVHRYFPRGEIGGVIGLLDFDRARIADLVERGFREAVEHDCKKNQCVIREGAYTP